jgi:hypothetical protein
MHPHVKKLLALLVILTLAALLAPIGCSNVKDRWRRVSGTRAPDSDLEEEAKAPPEARQETVVIDGKTWVRSRNPYYLTMPGEPEYVYAQQGKELWTMQGALVASIARQLGLDKKAQEAKGVPEEQVQERVRQEVDRILREQGLKAFYGQDKGKSLGVVGRYVGVYPNPESPRGMEGQNRTLTTALTESLSRPKDLKVAGPDKVKASLSKIQATGDLKQRQNLQALGDTLGVQALILTGVVPPSGKTPGFLVLEIYDTFKGTKVDGIAYPLDGPVDNAAIKKFVQNNSLKVAAALMNVDWFGRVEFVKAGNVYLALGDSTGLKVGDRLKVVASSKDVEITGDESLGQVKITELLGTSGAVAQTVAGGPFQPNDKVKTLR